MLKREGWAIRKGVPTRRSPGALNVLSLRRQVSRSQRTCPRNLRILHGSHEGVAVGHFTTSKVTAGVPSLFRNLLRDDGLPFFVIFTDSGGFLSGTLVWVSGFPHSIFSLFFVSCYILKLLKEFHIQAMDPIKR